MRISSISFDQEEIIQNIISLHCPHGIDCDPTYSKGIFYKNLTPPAHKFDISPQTSDTIQASSVKLPLADESIKSLMFDPPFLSTRGKSLEIKDDSNIINKRFGVFPSEAALFQYYIDSLAEFHRILEKNGVLIFKCQDKVNRDLNFFSHVYIHDEAVKLGFYPKDLFILLATSRLKGKNEGRQLHARKFHSYFWVFEKKAKKVDYLNYKK